MLSAVLAVACTSEGSSGVAADSAGPGADSGGNADSGEPARDHRMPVLDFGRGLAYIADPAQQAAAYDAFAPLVDVAEAARGSAQLAELVARAPGLVTFGYQLDLTACAHESCGPAMPLSTEFDTWPESAFLHFSEDTTVRFTGLDGSTVATQTIRGCTDSGALRADCRAQAFVWGDARTLFAVGDSAYRSAMAARLLGTTDDTVRGVFLDEHAPFLGDAIKLGVQTHLEQGGGLVEYDGRRPGDPSLDVDWNADVAGALAAFHGAFEAQDRFLLVNLATYALRDDALAQAAAAGGVTVEGLWRPDAFDGTERFLAGVGALRGLVRDGARVDLYGTLGYTGPAGYTPGGYADAATRYRMWRFAASMLVMAAPADVGTAYFNPTLDVDFQGDPLAWRGEWLDAFAVDLGAPTGEAALVADGRYTSSAGVDCPAWVVGRSFERGHVLVRARDAWNCSDWDAALSVTLPGAYRVLQPDGSAGARVTSLEVRNAEAFVLVP
jgi:hypothetical protein